MTFIRNFMLVIGPVSSVFDFLTFYVMLVVFRRARALFHTGWFIESLCHPGAGDLRHPHPQSIQEPAPSRC